MSALESLDGFLKQIERKMRMAAWARRVGLRTLGCACFVRARR